MLIGVPKEIKDNEYRVRIVPATVRELTDKGHQVLIEPALDQARACPTMITKLPAPNSSPTLMRSMAAPNSSSSQ